MKWPSEEGMRMTEFEERTVELANRLQDMTYAEWGRVRFLIDRRNS